MLGERKHGWGRIVTDKREPQYYIRKAVELYQDAPLLSRVYLEIRVRNFPINRMWPVLLSLSGQVVSLGAGYGIFELATAMANPAAVFRATDLNRTRIALGQSISRSVSNVRFEVFDLACGIPDFHPDVFLLLDVLHHLQPDIQEQVLKRVAESLRTSGRIIIKECGTHPVWKRWFNRLNDAVGAPFSSTYPRSEQDWSALLQQHGFTTTVERLDRGSPYAHILIEGVKK